MAKVFLSLGSNQNAEFAGKLREREFFLQKAEELISALPGVRECKSSRISETKAILKPNSPEEWDVPYLNQVIALITDLKPQQLLAEIQNIEQILGKKNSGRIWAPRVIDIDVLLYDDCVITESNLQIPHPELLARKFFIELILSLDDNAYYPNVGKLKDLTIR